MIEALGAAGTLLVATAAATIGLRQYKRSETWKGAEFPAQRMKEMLGERQIQAVLAMIDPDARQVALRAEGSQPEYVTRFALQRTLPCGIVSPHFWSGTNG